MRRFALDILLLLLLLLVMSFHFLPRKAHELLGIVLFIAALVHLYFNRQWFSALAQGKWSLLRLARTFALFLLIASFFTAVITGATISNFVFVGVAADMPLHRSIFIHQLHIVGAYIMLIASGLHFGMHWAGLWAQIKRHVPALAFIERHGKIRACLIVFAFLAGIIASRLAHVGDRLMMRHIFGTLLHQLPPITELFVMFLIMALYAIIFYYLQKYLLERQTSRLKAKPRG